MERLQKQKKKTIQSRRSEAECKVQAEQSMRENTWTGTKSRETTEMEISLSPPQQKDSTWVTEKYSHSSLVLGSHRLCYSGTLRIRSVPPNTKIYSNTTNELCLNLHRLSSTKCAWWKPWNDWLVCRCLLSTGRNVKTVRASQHLNVGLLKVGAQFHSRVGLY